MRRNPEDIARAARVFKSLSHAPRLQVACLLLERDVTTQKELIERLGWPQSTMSRHVDELRRAGLILSRRQGAEILLSLSSDVIGSMLDAVCEWFHEGAAGAGAEGPANNGR